MNLAVLSSDGVYRYTLTRLVDPELLGPYRGTVNFVMLNPSTADAQVDDPTVRKCMGFAGRWGFQRLVVTNLYALRATDSTKLLDHRDPVGPGNDAAIREAAEIADLVLVAWGNGPGPSLHLERRAEHVAGLIQKPLFCIEKNLATGTPRHPLYIQNLREPKPYALP